MRCQWPGCGGMIVERYDRLVCHACGREPLTDFIKVIKQTLLPDNIDPEKEEIMDEKVKNCPKCKKDFPATHEYFSKNKHRKDSLENWCKICRRKNQTEYRKKMAKEKENFLRPVKSPNLISPNLLTKASPEEIVKALRKGVVLELLQEIKGMMQKIEEKWA